MMVQEFKSIFEATHCSTGKLSRLLLVDDDPALLNALSDTIEFHLGPLTLDTSDSGTRALELVRANDYDAMIVDVNMPNMNGLEFMTAVKRLQPDTPVLLISAHADNVLSAKALGAGALALLGKPFDRNQIVMIVNEALELSPLRHLRQGL